MQKADRPHLGSHFTFARLLTAPPPAGDGLNPIIHPEAGTET
jgi:hypothetical protein